ncbi:putative transcription factor B3-Domain family [Rosa chinensis]|uniref:Putative transcription factor B3-Domain family n=1 Tax=Rosa chinensis TaxID=74649 RepID=A0A2P6RR87_ROSCH|nr:putative B3 domain-containing protein At1g78640 [Rosa chinensis]XP_024185672.1 putative B3 domain-containing protein At1g78640 [Rosa chinensis]PRQ48948.1 putative transcription factor B3-Domain family [Rosa chinensis]
MEHQVQDLSLELTLGGPYTAEPYQADTEGSADLIRIRASFTGFRVYSVNQEVEETKYKVSTRLTLCSSFDPWVFKKPLGHLDATKRLSLRKPWVDAEVLPNLNVLAKHQMQQGHRTWVRVFDKDTRSLNEVELKKEESFVFRDLWVHDFVNRRKLVAQDTVGLYWETTEQRFVFSVLKRIPRVPKTTSNRS